MPIIPLELDECDKAIAFKNSQLVALSSAIQELRTILKEIDKGLPAVKADVVKAQQQFIDIKADNPISLTNYKLAIRVIHTTEDTLWKANESKSVAIGRLKEFTKNLAIIKDELAVLTLNRSKWNQLLILPCQNQATK